MTHGSLTIYCFTDFSLLPLRYVHAIILHYVQRSDTTCVTLPRPSPTEPRSGPPLPTEPGTTKQCDDTDKIVYTLILPHAAHTSVFPPVPALAHQVLSRAALCCVGFRDSAGLYSEGICYNVMKLWTLSITCFSTTNY